MSQAQQEPVKQDDVQTEVSFHLGMVRDCSRNAIPEGGAYDLRDYLPEQPGRLYKRGGWLTHSGSLPAPPSAVFTIHLPTRVGAIVNGDLYDVTSEGGSFQADLMGTIGFSPGENPPTYVYDVIICDPASVHRPKRVFTSGAGGDLTIDDVDGNPPYAAHSAVYAGRIVLARGNPSTPSTGTLEHPNRVWFGPAPGDLPISGYGDLDWKVEDVYFDATYSVTGIVAIEGMLLIFSERHCERVINTIPPATADDENMELQPVGGVGCLDARSIAVVDNNVVFASEEGVFMTNGVGFDNLMEKSDRTGILSYWRSKFQAGQVRTIVGGMIMRDFYLLSTRFPSETDQVREDFLCYLPTKSWTRTKNTWSNMMAIGATEAETVETYSALAHENLVARMTPMLKPTWVNRSDGNGVIVEPVLETRAIGQGPGLKAYGFGRVSYDMRAESGTPTLKVEQSTGLKAENYQDVPESPLPATGHEERARFSLFRDSQSMNLRFTQQGASSETEVFLVEAENRPYGLPADGE